VDWEVFRAGSRNGEAGYSSESFREWLKDQNARRKVDSKVPPPAAHEAKRQMESSLGVTQSAAALVAAKQLNSFLNNQSLVVLFTFKGKKLLFVGDAQAGNWEHWLSDTDTPDKSASAAVNAQAQKILSSLDFYKVGHHGSANATPKAAVTLMAKRGQKLAAMCSTQADVYGKEDVANPVDGTEVPRLPLLEALRSATELVRSDQVAVTVDSKTVKPDAPAPLPAPSPAGRFEAGALWIDCFL
jgi:hypothetical protein